jgi:hypothetical protein
MIHTIDIAGPGRSCDPAHRMIMSIMTETNRMTGPIL